MKKILAVATVAFLALGCTVGVSQNSLAGEYTLRGSNPGAAASGGYTGTVVISENNRNYRLTYRVGNSITNAIGFVQNGVLVVGFDCGVTAYEIRGRVLEGTWARCEPGDFRGTETLTRR
jgi:hypothetical protein